MELEKKLKHGASHRFCKSHVQRQEKELRAIVEIWKTSALRENSLNHQNAHEAALELAKGLKQSARGLALKTLGCMMNDAMYMNE